MSRTYFNDGKTTKEVWSKQASSNGLNRRISLDLRADDAIL